MQLISAFVLATKIVQSLYLLNPKFQASSHLVSGLVGNPEDRFSHDTAHLSSFYQRFPGQWKAQPADSRADCATDV